MPARRKPTIAKSASIDKNIETAIEKLTAASLDGGKAVATRTKEGKKLTAAVRRLSKKRATLMRRKKTATTRAKNAPSAETRGALRTVLKDITSVTKELDKLRPQKNANAEELAALKAGERKATAYLKSIEKADKVLNKPKRKRRARRTA